MVLKLLKRVLMLGSFWRMVVLLIILLCNKEVVCIIFIIAYKLSVLFNKIVFVFLFNKVSMSLECSIFEGLILENNLFIKVFFIFLI